MKKKLLEMLGKKEERKQTLIDQSKTSEDVAQLRSINTELEQLNAEIAEMRSIIDGLPEETAGETEGETRQVGNFNPLSTYRTTGTEVRNDVEEDIFGSLEYRQAFKAYVIKGTPIPDKFNAEQRADALTMVGDVAAVIPTNLLNQVIEDLTVEGKILSRINQTAYQGAVEIPISEINPTATWLANEETVSEDQKAKMTAKIKFGYHVLEARVAIGLLSATVSLPIFETTIVRQLKKAMIVAIEDAIVSGTGNGQPKGFTKYNLPASQIVEMATDNIGTVKAWANVEAKIPEAEESSVIYVMSKATWESYINGMTDTTGQRIGLGKINEKGQKTINGREVLTVDKLPSFDAAGIGSIFAVVVDLNKYALNSNMAMYYKKYFNDDKNKWIHKALMIVDGQMAIGQTQDNKLVGANGLIYIKKKAPQA